MKLFTVSALLVILTVVCLPSLTLANAPAAGTEAAATGPRDLGYLKVTVPFVNIYAQLDPKSEIVRQTKKDEFFKISKLGETWAMVEVDGKQGWIEQKYGKVVKSDGGVSGILVTFIIIIVIGVGVGGYLFLNKAKQSTSEKIDDDI